ncbi:hypothetical protein ARMGADRAFT_1031367 [Armillaria gallica]|uniref:Uncharacterized protein n=1 Tax=Armillaria gallica TaxID=47427 RepID=A0A2H3D9H6_ARMGA|nr:hypothetical protein ARMGADRAFT_1031367 [Armillaria gallica]
MGIVSPGLFGRWIDTCLQDIALTLLVGCIAVGHACPDDSWKGSVMTSPLCFGQDRTEKSSLGYFMVVDEDVEAQSGRGSNSHVDEQEEGSYKSMYMNVDWLALIKEDTVGEGLDVISSQEEGFLHDGLIGLKHTGNGLHAMDGCHDSRITHRLSWFRLVGVIYSAAAHYMARFMDTERCVWYNDSIMLGWWAQLKGYMDEMDMMKNQTRIEDQLSTTTQMQWPSPY